MIMMALMLFVIVVSYLVMLGLVKFAESVIDEALPARLRDAVPSDTNATANPSKRLCILAQSEVTTQRR